MNDNSNNLSPNNQLAASDAKDLRAAEVEQATDGLAKRCLVGCFRFLRRLFFVTIGVYILMIGFLAFFENRLVYPGSKYPAGNWEFKEQGITEVEFAAADGTKLFGWYLPLTSSPSPSSQSGIVDGATAMRPRTILHCHGNGENIAQVGAFSAKQFSRVLQANVFTFDYRGFGKSEGAPTEEGVKEDADAALAWLCERDKVQPTDVIIVGHSLGGGLATYLAKKHGCKALILQRTFSSLPDAAARKYWMFPVHWIMQNQMNSAEAIKSCDVPLFQSHGEADGLVPIDFGRKVYDNSPAADKKFFAVPGMTHWDHLPKEYWVELESFFEKVAPQAALEKSADKEALDLPFGARAYFGIIGLLALFENRMLYPGSKYPAGNWDHQSQGFTEVEFAAADNTKLFGWYLPQTNDLPSPEAVEAGAVDTMRPRTLLHCHGKGENIAQVGSFIAKKFSEVLHANVFTYDYRGFGKSEGAPTEAGLEQDADAALAWLCERDGVQPADVIIVGDSLGGGLACYLAKKHGCKALVLRRTFSSLPDAAARMYPRLPVRWLMRNRMNSAKAIKSCNVPLFQSHGEADGLVPIDLGRKLFDNSPTTDKKFFSVPGMPHWYHSPKEYWIELEAFFEQIDPRKPLDQ